jgi:hypothetical protein
MKTLSTIQEENVQGKLGTFDRYVVVKFFPEGNVEIIHRTGDLHQAISVCAKAWSAMGDESAMVYANPHCPLFQKEAFWNEHEHFERAVRKQWKEDIAEKLVTA